MKYEKNFHKRIIRFSKQHFFQGVWGCVTLLWCLRCNHVEQLVSDATIGWKGKSFTCIGPSWVVFRHRLDMINISLFLNRPPRPGCKSLCLVRVIFAHTYLNDIFGTYKLFERHFWLSWSQDKNDVNFDCQLILVWMANNPVTGCHAMLWDTKKWSDSNDKHELYFIL